MKIGIIGGGAAGLTCAWLLDQDCDVTLFEKQDHLGGHADTVQVELEGETIPIDAGFEFFSDEMFPYFNRLLSILNVSVHKYPLTYTFYKTDGSSTIAIPPFHDNAISWNTLLPINMFDLIDLNHIIAAGKTVVDTKNTSITIEQFIENIPLLPEGFKNGFLYPFLAAGWGAPLNDFKKFAAYDVLTWCVKNKPGGMLPLHWNEVVGGTGTYIQALAGELSHTKVKLSSAIVSVTYLDGTYTVTESNGTVSYFDHLVLATDAYEARELLKDIPHTLDVRSILASVSYFHTVIAVHGDKRFMPLNKSDWSVINVRYTGSYSLITVFKSWKSRSPVFRSWITYDAQDALPEPLYALRNYYHPKVDLPYFQAQKALALVQGNYNLWFAGLYTYGVDSHDSAIFSAVHIAQRLAPQSRRLQALTS